MPLRRDEPHQMGQITHDEVEQFSDEPPEVVFDHWFPPESQITRQVRQGT